MKTVHIRVTGKVQGVFYRASSKAKAAELGINGWVCNTKDGAVEALATGEIDAVEKFINWCNQGPAGAKVEAVVVKEMEEEVFYHFTIRRGQ